MQLLLAYYYIIGGLRLMRASWDSGPPRTRLEPKNHPFIRRCDVNWPTLPDPRSAAQRRERVLLLLLVFWRGEPRQITRRITNQASLWSFAQSETSRSSAVDDSSQLKRTSDIVYLIANSVAMNDARSCMQNEFSLNFVLLGAKSTH